VLEKLKLPCLTSSWLRKESDMFLRKEPLEIVVIAFVLQERQKFSHASISKYLSNHDMTEVSRVINEKTSGYSAIYYAIARNCIQSVKTLLEYGADANTRDTDDVPVLAFAIMHALQAKVQTIEMVKLLLMFGANPYSIPADMWKDFVAQPDPMGVNHEHVAQWCTEKYRLTLANALNLSQRYFLMQASLQKDPTERETQIVKKHKLKGLFSMPFQLIGQTYAATSIQKEIMNHVLGGEGNFAVPALH